MTQNDEMTNRNYDLLLSQLCPWGSEDVWHMIKTAEAVNLDMYKLAEILQEQAEEWGINLYNDSPYTTDVNALLNDYILHQAATDIEDVLDINILDYDTYFYANYLDCPLQYTEELKELIETKIINNEVIESDFSDFSHYVLDKMDITLKI